MRRAALILVGLISLLLWLNSYRETPADLVAGLDGRRRHHCFTTLRDAGERVVPAIIEGTHHPRPHVRRECARLLGQRQDVEMVQYLEPMLADPDAEVRQHAARALTPLLDNEELLAMLSGTRLAPILKLEVAHAMLADATAVASPPLLNWCLNREHPVEVRKGAYLALRETLGNVDPKAAAKPILEARTRIFEQARQDAFDESCPLAARDGAWQLYASLRGAEAIGEIRPLAHSKDKRVRELAVNALVSAGGDQAAALVCEIGRDASQPEDVRVLALSSLRSFRWNTAALQAAREGLTEEKARLRAAAAQSVAALGDKNAPDDASYGLKLSLEAIRKALAGEQDPEARAALQTALANIDARRADRQLKKP